MLTHQLIKYRIFVGIAFTVYVVIFLLNFQKIITKIPIREEKHSIYQSAPDRTINDFQYSCYSSSSSSNSTHCSYLVKGKPLFRDLDLKNHRVKLVVSYCSNEEKTLLNEYVKKNAIFVELILISTSNCTASISDFSSISNLKTHFFYSKYITTNEAFLDWMLNDNYYHKEVPKKQSHSVMPQNNLLFLNAKNLMKSHKITAHVQLKGGLPKPIKTCAQYIRFESTISLLRKYHSSLKNLIYTANERGIACFLEPLTASHSIYYDGKVISLNNSAIQENIIPICHGGSFMIPETSLLRSKLAKLQDFFAEFYARSENFDEILDSSWAHLFSYKLYPHVQVAIQNQANYGLDECHNKGAFLSSFSIQECMEKEGDELCSLWENKISSIKQQQLSNLIHVDGSTSLKFSLVISHCNEDMSWMKEYFTNLPNIQNVTIISKCNADTSSSPFAENITTVIRLPNIGRCDHSYAYYLNRFSASASSSLESSASSSSDYILFFKASRRIKQTASAYPPLLDLIKLASLHGFSCGQQPSSLQLSSFHDHDTLTKFAIKRYSRQNIGSEYPTMLHWLTHLNITLPFPIIPACYGGNFVVKVENLLKLESNKTWQNMEKSLERGDNIEEGHFAERSWAALLRNPLDKQQMDFILRYANAITEDAFGFLGMLSRY